MRFTDSGSVWYDSSPQWAQAALEDSLRRLGTDRIDLLQMHYWDGVTVACRRCSMRSRACGAAAEIRWYGTTNHSA